MKKTVLVLALISAILFCSCGEISFDENKQTTAQTTQTVQTAQTTEDTAQLDTEADQLSEFDINKVVFNPYTEYKGLDFLSEEQLRIFELADFIYTAFDIDQSEFFRANGMEVPTETIDDTIFFHTGFTYESVLNGFLSVLSEDIVSDLSEQKFDNIDGEFVCGAGARGVNAAFLGTLEFEAVEAADDIVKFKAKAGFGDPNADTEEITSYEEFNFEMRKTDGKWIVTKFEMWM